MPDPPRIGGPFDDVNDAFHRHYDEARRGSETQLPVLVVLADELIRFRGDEQRTFPITPREFHAIKSVAHLPLAVCGVLYTSGDRAALEALRAQGQAARGTAKDMDAIIAETDRFLAAVLSGAAADVDGFAAALGPRLLELTDRATGLQLDALDRAANDAVEGFTDEEHMGFAVVVTGDHQARARSLAMQYFRKRLGEESGAEKRVLYGEAISDAREARALVGKNRLDRRLARAFFGDEHRLQRDILGDAAAARLDGFTPSSSRMLPHIAGRE